MTSPTKNGHAAAGVAETVAPDLQTLALAYLAGGVSLVPCSSKTKQPDFNLLPKDNTGKATWEPYQAERPTPATVARWFKRGCQSVAAIGGKVSGGLLILDFDVARFYEAWKLEVGPLADPLPLQRTGRVDGGFQVALRCLKPGQSTKLAWVPDETEETGRKCAIETKAEGGYAVMPGSLHPTGRRYEAISGDFANIPTVPQAVADALLAAARKLDECPFTRQQLEAQRKAAETSEKHKAGSNGQASVIDAYNQATTIEAELKARGYIQCGDRWKRPGGKSLSVFVSEGRSFHHSSNDPLSDGYWHLPFDVYCQFEHGGDCKKAVKAAAELLGIKSSKKKKTSGHKNTSESFPLTDTGLAERFANQHGGAVRYCHAWGKSLCWDKQRWKIDDQGAIDQLAKQTARSILAEAANEPDDDDRKALVSFAHSAESAHKREAMLKLARSEPPIPIVPAALDKDPWIFNCPNGSIDLHTGKLCEHRREDYITKLCPVEYQPDAPCPTWLKTLDRIFDGDHDVTGYLQRFIGYCLTGDVSEQILNIWHGVGANGKSTVANALMEMLGPDYAMKAAADLLLQKYGNEHPTALTDLHGKRFVACIETDDGRRMAESLVKELTGGDIIRARRMREDYWEFSPTHKVVLACNHRPTVRGTDHAIWRRLRLVPFSVVIPPHERDKHLPAKLRAELAGILAWAVRGCLDWQRQGLGEPKAVVEATAEYQTAEDTLRNFIQDCCTTGPGARVKAAALLDSYREWSGDRHITVRKLTGILTEVGIQKYTNNGLWYRGVGLLDNGTTEQRNDF